MKEVILQTAPIGSPRRAAFKGRSKQKWFEAAAIGDVEIIRSMLTSGADVNAVDDEGRTALILAARYGHANVVKEIVAVRGVDVNWKSSAGWTALDWAETNESDRIVGLLTAHHSWKQPYVVVGSVERQRRLRDMDNRG